jgi:hypothetical protein
MFVFFKSTITYNDNNGFSEFMTKLLSNFSWTDHSHAPTGAKKKDGEAWNRICPLGKGLSFVAGAYLLGRCWILWKAGKADLIEWRNINLTILLVGTLVGGAMNLNVAVYLIPVILVEIFIMSFLWP